jgi:membrane protein involved in colicin uptake
VADKKSADAAAALKVKRAKEAIASAAKAAAQKAAARAAAAKSTANATARMLGSPSNVARTDIGQALKSRSDSGVPLNKERVKISGDNNEVKFYRGHECSMAVIFPDDREFALACAGVRKARSV